ncbi:class I SAM-dependent methyltransferase [Actinomadura kijaniata]|uniref:class I SAM-dependent methyltransferase n=1 Tax=Actinomadura kijaniata TaxID=46161 RepID=UPI000834E1B8|nr:class I SAM-dependent methyltransferase [Actinomadura kijaniata]
MNATTNATRRRHRLFARCYGRLSPAMEQGVAEHRRTLLRAAAGHVLEVGAGAGANFAHYPAGVTRVLAVEPEPHLRRLAGAAAREAPVPVQVVDGVAERLEVPDESFDAVVACLVLCSVGDRHAALAEMFRVLRPGGRLHFFEHVPAQSPGLRRVQRVLDATVWPLLNGGCHLAPDTQAAIRRAGFRYDRLHHLNWPDTRPPLPPSPHILGVATRPHHV